jgi:bacillithiol system protein YtxJ
MNWIKLNHPQQLTQLLEDSKQRPVLIFKHSSRCSISRAALDRLERNWKAEEAGQIDQYFLDLLSYREISNQIERLFQVDHESPQVLVVDKGKVIYHRSHFDIDYRNLMNSLKVA